MCGEVCTYMNIACAWLVNKDLGYENQKQIEMKAKKKKDEQMQERNETECDRRQRGN
jgi:hypothetical protein